jgi:hypothetical protein
VSSQPQICEKQGDFLLACFNTKLVELALAMGGRGWRSTMFNCVEHWRSITWELGSGLGGVGGALTREMKRMAGDLNSVISLK